MTYYDPFTGKPYTQPQMTTPTTGGTNTAGTQPTTTMQPTSVWDTQPKPKTNALAGPLPDAFGGPAQGVVGGSTTMPWGPGSPNYAGAITQDQYQHWASQNPDWKGTMQEWQNYIWTHGRAPGSNLQRTQAGSVQTPPQQTVGYTGGLPSGFDIRAGSMDPAINQRIYGSNYFPGGLAGFEGVTNADQFWALTPQQQGDYRNALYNYNQRLTQQPGGGGGSVPGPGGVPLPGQYQFPDNFKYPAFSYNQVEDYRQNPAYQNQLRESERALNRQLLARGRSDSTGGINALATNQRRLGAEFEQKAYERAVTEDNNNYARLREQNTTEYDRALMMNKLMYDRGYQERITDYEQKFRENERQYGRAKAEEQLAYDRQWNEAARDYAYWKYLVEVGLRASGVPAA